ncbi:MAG: hypothetical protein L3K08_04250, partial [Thermoplasmata archaeon]|nr:hypothetical protein [Thermoplasmata archaeon]
KTPGWDEDPEQRLTEEELKIGLVIYQSLRSIRTIDGEGIAFNMKKFETVYRALRYVVPKAIREDGSLSDDQRRAMRKKVIAAKRGLDFIGDVESPHGISQLKVFFEVLYSLGGQSQDFLDYIEFDYDDGKTLRPG